MTDCYHPKIRTWFLEDANPAGLWSCAVCRVKFVPLLQLNAEVEAEREACAKLLDDNASQCTTGLMNQYILTSNAQAIRARTTL